MSARQGLFHWKDRRLFLENLGGRCSENVPTIVLWNLPGRFSSNIKNSAIACPKSGWERRRGHTDSNMTLHTYSDIERNTPNIREGVLREGSVSPRWMREAMHGANASYSPPMVAAERTLPVAGLSRTGWPPRQPYRQAFSLAVGLPGARVGMVAPQLSGAWGRGAEQKHQGTFNRFFDAAWLNTVWMRGAP